MSLLGLCWLCCGLRLARFFLGVEKCAAEVQWPGNTRHRCLWIPRPGHNDRAKIENAAKDALVDLDAFNFMNIDFDCGTANKPKLCYDALVGNCKFRCEVSNRGRSPKQQSDTEESDK